MSEGGTGQLTRWSSSSIAIATKCKSCSFAQFITWIPEEEDESPVNSKFAAYKAKNGKGYVPTSVDDGAKWLNDNSITRRMRLFRVVHDVYDVPNLFRTVSNFTSAYRKK
ncbi:hypothetical protein N7463_005719 [Penicillium fimorum]|uniref:Uncharacterized protein n=1 Tax=Penicillium fimorum TaxID=1882269 RepID=A0A9W9XUL9_9EURO|nr:hypothetical protein N7463_005719 [Penicillium fimorum]